MRATDAEAHLIGKKLRQKVLAEVSLRTLTQAKLRTSKHRATQAYRQELIGVLVQRNFGIVNQRIHQTEVVPEGIGLA
jgi:CO/xanthine dehydrogenase FAD-binding subunit